MADNVACPVCGRLSRVGMEHLCSGGRIMWLYRQPATGTVTGLLMMCLIDEHF